MVIKLGNITHVMPSGLNNPCKNAFTLVEILITIAIIGIVAALVLPGVMTNHQERERIAKLKKTYNIISQAYQKAISENGDFTTWDINSYADYENIMNKYLPNMKSPNTTISHSAKYLRDNSQSRGTDFRINTILKDGTYVYHGPFFSDYRCDISYGYACLNFTVDLNGKRPPNRYGHDIFTFVALKDRVVPLGNPGNSLNQNLSACDPTQTTRITTPFRNGEGCTAWVIQQGNMDYLKCIKGEAKYCVSTYYSK